MTDARAGLSPAITVTRLEGRAPRDLPVERRLMIEDIVPARLTHGLSDLDFETLFTRDAPVVFAFHRYPWLIHRLAYRRPNHANFHVRGYKEEGTVTTPFDMAVMNDLDRFHLAADVIDRVPRLGAGAAYVKQALAEKVIEHREYVRAHGEDLPEIRDWRWVP